VDQLIYIFECRLLSRDENSSLDTKTLIGSSLRNRFRKSKATSSNSFIRSGNQSTRRGVFALTKIWQQTHYVPDDYVFFAVTEFYNFFIQNRYSINLAMAKNIE